MPDLSKLNARLANTIADAGNAQTEEPQKIVNTGGVDASSLTGLTPAAVCELLIANGIDVSTMADGEIERLFMNLNSGAHSVDAFLALWSGGSPDGHD